MRNAIGFANRKGYPKPSFYQVVFGGWCAVYYDADCGEYHVQLNPEPWGWQEIDPATGLSRNARNVEVLKKHPDCRRRAAIGNDRFGGFPTIKGALDALAPLLNRTAAQEAAG